MDFLMQQIGPFPLVVWAGIVVGGALLAWWLSRRLGGGGGARANAPTADPNIDQTTGLPYTVENQTDPRTGLPVYTLYNPPPTPTGGGGGGPPPPGDHLLSTAELEAQGIPANYAEQFGGKYTLQQVLALLQQFGGTNQTPPGIQPGGLGRPGEGFTPAATGGSYQTAYGASWPEPNHTLYDVWQDHGAGIAWSDWEPSVRRLNPHVGKSGRLLPNEPVRIP
jgi:hypothetical protein